ncbi:hypothetical protein K438DRAFT_1885252 [Mycena galopus ATCC 62051]|nr:hypothetical protein K438DRAFT_1885252 [Mycena galopus ATCC 62051]
MPRRRGDRFWMGYDRARECWRSTEGERTIWLARNDGGGKGRRPRVTGSEGQ